MSWLAWPAKGTQCHVLVPCIGRRRILTSPLSWLAWPAKGTQCHVLFPSIGRIRILTSPLSWLAWPAKGTQCHVLFPCHGWRGLPKAHNAMYCLPVMVGVACQRHTMPCIVSLSWLAWPAKGTQCHVLSPCHGWRGQPKAHNAMYCFPCHGWRGLPKAHNAMYCLPVMVGVACQRHTMPCIVFPVMVGVACQRHTMPCIVCLSWLAWPAKGTQCHVLFPCHDWCGLPKAHNAMYCFPVMVGVACQRHTMPCIVSLSWLAWPAKGTQCHVLFPCHGWRGQPKAHNAMYCFPVMVGVACQRHTMPCIVSLSWLAWPAKGTQCHVLFPCHGWCGLPKAHNAMYCFPVMVGVACQRHTMPCIVSLSWLAWPAKGTQCHVLFPCHGWCGLPKAHNAMYCFPVMIGVACQRHTMPCIVSLSWLAWPAKGTQCHVLSLCQSSWGIRQHSKTNSFYNI